MYSDPLVVSDPLDDDSLILDVADEYCYAAWPKFFEWLYTWRTVKRKHMNTFSPVVNGRLGPLLHLADRIGASKLTSDLVIFIQREEQRGTTFDNYLSRDEIRFIAKRGPMLIFLYLCDHWCCHKALNEKQKYICDNVDQDEVCAEPDHRFGIGSFSLEHWMNEDHCPSKRSRASEQREHWTKGLALYLRWNPEKQKEVLRRKQPSPADLTCEHFRTCSGSRIDRSTSRRSIW